MLVSKVETKMKEALREKSTELKEDYSYLLSLFRAKEIELRRDLTDNEAIEVIQKEVKSLTKDFNSLSGNQCNTSYAMTLQRQITLYSEYLPKLMSYDEIMDYIADLSADCELPTNFGIAMKTLRKELGAKADGKALSKALKDFMTKESK